MSIGDNPEKYVHRGDNPEKYVRRGDNPEKYNTGREGFSQNRDRHLKTEKWDFWNITQTELSENNGIWDFVLRFYGIRIFLSRIDGIMWY